MAEFSLDRVVEILTERGVANAHVETTGGNTATIFAGPTFEQPGYGTRHAVCAGPGWVETTGGMERYLADTEDFTIGPDSDEGDADQWTVTADASPEKVADVIAAYVANWMATRPALT